MRPTLLASTACATALIALVAGAKAQPSNPATGSMADPSSSALVAQPEDWAGFAHVGYHLDPHWRVELQGGYHAATTSPAGAVNLCAAPLAGVLCGPRELGLGAYSAVANLVYDAMPDSRWFDPFVAFGAGVSRPDPAEIAAISPALQQLEADARGSLAYQAVVGLAFRPHDRLHLDLSYRWLGATGASPLGQAAAFNSRYYQDQTVAISVRYALSSPRAAVAPAPALGFASPAGLGAPAPHTVVVETPANPAALAAEAQAAVRQTTLSAIEGRGSQVVVDGHADTASAADYNRRLAERRAKAMADAMVSLGVPASALAIRWGEGADAAPAMAQSVASQ
jgi:opacity protein-like surface antigen